MPPRGPNTSTGKALVRLNALRHGLRSSSPVIPGEREEDWQAHHAGVCDALAPDGYLEEALAGRIALLLWFQDRLTRYERATITAALDHIETDLAARYPLDAGGADPVAHARAELHDAEESQRLLSRLPELPDAAAGVDAGRLALPGLSDAPDDWEDHDG